MPAVNLDVLAATASQLENFRNKINIYIEQLEDLNRQMSSQSYMEQAQKGLSRQIEELREESAVVSQMIRALRQTGELYSRCEQEIIDSYENERKRYPISEIGLNKIYVNDNLSGIVSILMGNDGEEHE